MKFYIGYILNLNNPESVGLNPYCCAEGLADKFDTYEVEDYIAGKNGLCPKENKAWYLRNKERDIETLEGIMIDEGMVEYSWKVGDFDLDQILLNFKNKKVKITIEEL